METKHSQAPVEFVERYYLSDVAERDSPESKWSQAWLGEVRGRRVLSVGCGPTLYDDIQFFGKVPNVVVGIDFNEHNLEFLRRSVQSELTKARKVVENHGTSVSLVHGDVRKARREFVGQFDVLYAGAVLGMYEDHELKPLLRLLRTYLAPEGRIVDIDWTDCRLPCDLYNERLGYGWYSKAGPGIARIGGL